MQYSRLSFAFVRGPVPTPTQGGFLFVLRVDRMDLISSGLVAVVILLVSLAGLYVVKSHRRVGDCPPHCSCFYEAGANCCRCGVLE
jgi:hypothetical protein